MHTVTENAMLARFFEGTGVTFGDIFIANSALSAEPSFATYLSTLA